MRHRPPRNNSLTLSTTFPPIFHTPSFPLARRKDGIVNGPYVIFSYLGSYLEELRFSLPALERAGLRKARSDFIERPTRFPFRRFQFTTSRLQLFNSPCCACFRSRGRKKKQARRRGIARRERPFRLRFVEKIRERGGGGGGGVESRDAE